MSLPCAETSTLIEPSGFSFVISPALSYIHPVLPTPTPSLYVTLLDFQLTRGYRFIGGFQLLWGFQPVRGYPLDSLLIRVLPQGYYYWTPRGSQCPPKDLEFSPRSGRYLLVIIQEHLVYFSHVKLRIYPSHHGVQHLLSTLPLLFFFFFFLYEGVFLKM